MARHKDKDAYKLVSIEKVQRVLDESMQISSSIVGSRYVKRLQKEAQEMQDRLTLICDTLEQWRECQRNWLYLENIFSSPDIRRQRAEDHADYDKINKAWTKLMKATHAKRNVRAQCTGADAYFKEKGHYERRRLREFLEWNK